MVTQFHFDQIEVNEGICKSPIAGEVSFYSSGLGYKTIGPGQMIDLRKGREYTITFDLKNWSECSLKSIAFNYHFYGKLNLYDYQGRVAEAFNFNKGKGKYFTNEIRISRIFNPIFKYSAFDVESPEIKEMAGTCELSNYASPIYNNNPLPTLIKISADCNHMPTKAFQANLMRALENPGAIKVRMRDVVAQHQDPFVPDRTKSNWYYNEKLPVYHYTYIEITTLVKPLP